MRFKATIYKEGINFLVQVPEEISLAFKSKRYIYVKGSVNGQSFKSTLVPGGGGSHKLFLNSEVRNATGLREGGIANIEVKLDTETRELPVPIDLADALEVNREIAEVFDHFSTSHRRELILWLEEAKRPETRLKRLDKVIEHIREKMG